jgi:hypothetical protein
MFTHFNLETIRKYQHPASETAIRRLKNRSFDLFEFENAVLKKKDQEKGIGQKYLKRHNSRCNVPNLKLTLMKEDAPSKDDS